MPIELKDRMYAHTLALTRVDAMNFARSLFPDVDPLEVLKFNESSMKVSICSPDDGTVLATHDLVDENESSVLTLHKLQ